MSNFYRGMNRVGAIQIAGQNLPNYAYEAGTQTIATLVNESRNAQGQVIGQRIGRDQVKLEINWDGLSDSEWRAILGIFDKNFVNEVRYYDAVSGTFKTRLMYVGDRSGRPFNPDELMRPAHWLNCQANLIDMGVGD